LTTKTAIELPEMTKHQLASRILDEVMALRRPAQLVAESGLVSSNSNLRD
jgi:phosphopantothenoylcysteine decarboxylase/phosphopantothenate--cysteine ligase